MKVSYKKAIKENNLLKLKIDEQQHNIKHLLKQCEIVGEGKVQEVTASRIAIKKNKSGNMCVTNNQILATTTRTKSAWKKYIHDQHTELWCKYCGKIVKK